MQRKCKGKAQISKKRYLISNTLVWERFNNNLKSKYIKRKMIELIIRIFIVKLKLLALVNKLRLWEVY